MPSVLKFINLLVTGVSLGLVCPTSGCEVFGNVSAASPDVWETSTSWQQSTPNSVLFINSTNEFVVDEACHTQELSSVNMYNSLSSLEDPKIVFFKQGTISGTYIKESRGFHWMRYDVQNTILISAGLCLCTATLFGFIYWIRPASQPPCSFQTKQTGHQDHPRIARSRSSPDRRAESSFERWVDPLNCFPPVIQSQTTQVSQTLDIYKSNQLPSNEYSRETSPTKAHAKKQHKFVQCASGRSKPTQQFSAASNEPVQSTPQQPSSIISPGRSSQLQPSSQPNVPRGSPLQRPHQPVTSKSLGTGHPKQSPQCTPPRRHASNQKEGLPKPTGSVSPKQSSQTNLYGSAVFIQKPHQPARDRSLSSGHPKQSPQCSPPRRHAPNQKGGPLKPTGSGSPKQSTQTNLHGSPVFIQKQPKPIGLTFRDSIPLNALQCKGCGRLNRPQTTSLLPIGSLLQSNQRLSSWVNESTLSDQLGSKPAQSTAQKSLKHSQQNGLAGPVLIQRPPKPIGLKFRDSIPLNALQLKGYRGLLISQY